MRTVLVFAAISLLAGCRSAIPAAASTEPYVVALGVAQDGGYPQGVALSVT